MKSFLIEKKHYFIITKLQTTFCLAMEIYPLVLNGNSFGDHAVQVQMFYATASLGRARWGEELGRRRW